MDSEFAGKTGCSVVGIPGHAARNVTLSNVTIRSRGSGGIALIGNDLTRVGAVGEFAEGADPASLRSAGNLEPKSP